MSEFDTSYLLKEWWDNKKTHCQVLPLNRCDIYLFFSGLVVSVPHSPRYEEPKLRQPTLTEEEKALNRFYDRVTQNLIDKLLKKD